MKINKEEILINLLSLPQEDLKSIQEKLNFLIKNTSTKKKEKNLDYEEVLYEAISSNLKQLVGINMPKFYIFKKKSPKKVKILTEVVNFVHDYLNQIVPLDNIKSTTKNRILQLFAGITTKRMYDFSIESDIPLTLTLVLNNYESFPSYLDKEFPGYVKSNLMYLIFSGKKVKKSEKI